MKTNKLLRTIQLLIWFLELVALAFTVATVWRMNILPDQYLMILVAAAAAVWVLTGLLLLPGKTARSGKIRRCAACVLALLVVIGCAVLTTVASDIYETMHDIVDDPTDDGVYRGVYLRADDPAQTLADTKHYTFAKVTNYDKANTGAAIVSIERTVGGKITVEEFSSVSGMVDALLDGSVDAIILNSAYVSVLEENANYKGFAEQTKLLCRVKILEEDIPQTTEPTGTEPAGTSPTEDPELTVPPTMPTITMPTIAMPKDITETPFVIYVSGSDARSSLIQDSRTDVNILVVVNPETKQVLLINTPRDYYIPNPAGGGAKDKLTHCGWDGISNTMQALSDLYGVPIKYYAQVNFYGFETFIDAIGGVTVYSDYTYMAIDTQIYRGENYLSGYQALCFARERTHVPGGDTTRGKHQMRVVKAAIQKMTSSTALITGYADILDSLSGMFRTNVSVNEMSHLVKMQLDDMATWEISTYGVKGRGDGSGVMAYTYSAPDEPLWVLPPDYEAVAHASMLIEKVVTGGIITEEDLEGPTA